MYFQWVAGSAAAITHQGVGSPAPPTAELARPPYRQLLKGDGTVDRIQMAGCASPELANAEMTAIQQASPLPPVGTTVNLTVRTVAPIATPGIDGK